MPEYRFCADLRILNSKVLKDNLFTGSVPANLALLEKHNIYSALDLFNAFESCELEPTSHGFFAFSSPAVGSPVSLLPVTPGIREQPGNHVSCHRWTPHRNPDLIPRSSLLAAGRRRARSKRRARVREYVESRPLGHWPQMKSHNFINYKMHSINLKVSASLCMMI